MWKCRKCGEGRAEYVEGPVFVVNPIVNEEGGLFVDFGSAEYEDYSNSGVEKYIRCRHCGVTEDFHGEIVDSKLVGDEDVEELAGGEEEVHRM